MRPAPVCTFSDLHAAAAVPGSRGLAVAGALGDSVLAAVATAAERGLVTPHLTGPAARIRARIDALGLQPLCGATIHDAPETEAASCAVRLVREGTSVGIDPTMAQQSRLLPTHV